MSNEPQPQPPTGIHHNMPNEDYRSADGLSATFLKGCLRSVKHAMTPRKPTKATDTGLRLHEFILERDKFLSTYAAGIDLSEHPDAIGTLDELKAAIEKLNESRKPKLAKTGSVQELTERLYQDDPHHFDGVQDVSKLTAADLKKKIEFVNSDPCRGVLPTSGSAMAITQRLIENGYTGEITHELIRQHNERHADRVILPVDEYNRYQAMYDSLLKHLRIGADNGDSLFAWLLAALTGSVPLETEVSVFATDSTGKASKCRLDARFDAGGKRIGIELKSTADATVDAFTRQCARLHYDLQHEHYLTVCRDAGEPLDAMVFIAVETEAPFGVTVLTADEEFRLTGAKKLAYAKRRYAEYVARGEQNTVYSPTLKTLTSPLWNACGPWELEQVEE